MPSKEVIQTVLYGDPENSAEDADVIALFLRGLHINPKDGGASLRHFLKSVLRQGEDYLFNEDDEGLAYPNVPALPLTTPVGATAALYCAVHRRNVGDWVADGDLTFSDVFPLPIRLACRSRPDPKAKEPQQVERYVLVQEVVLRCEGTFVHLKLLGACLDPRPTARLRQLEELQREFLAWEQMGIQYAGVIVGDFGTRAALGDELLAMVETIDAPEQKKKKKKDTKPATTSVLTAAGITALCEVLADPAARRAMLLSSEDPTGALPSAVKLGSVFRLHTDLVRDEPDFPVPLPTSHRRGAEAVLGGAVGFPVRTDGLLTWAQLAGAADKLADFDYHMDIRTAYAFKNQLQPKYAPFLQHQCGWLDGIGVLREGGLPARLLSCDPDPSVLAFDHVPLKATVEVTPPSGNPPLRVWVGTIKLDNRAPDLDTLQHFMYDTPGNSAEGADVIALFFTDLFLTDATIDGVRSLLSQVVRDKDAYMFNEEDPALGIRNIPAVLVKIKDGQPRYVALFTCVRREHVEDFDHDNNKTFNDCFPVPPALMCRSYLRNEFAPAFKAHLVQEVILHCPAGYYRLVLMGLNFDTFSDAQLCQVDAMGRLMQACAMNQLPYTAIMFGDFNNRLVCCGPDQVQDPDKPLPPGAKSMYTMRPEAHAAFEARLEDPAQRREIFLAQDSWVWRGVDALGKETPEPPLCFQKLGQMIATMRDLVAADPNYVVPLPTYKRTPVNKLLTAAAGFHLEPASLITADRLRAGIANLRSLPAARPPITPASVRDLFFSGDQATLPLDSTAEGPPTLPLGWPDGLGVYRAGPLSLELFQWDTAEECLGSGHAPVRGSVLLTVNREQASSPLPRPNRPPIFP